MCYNAIEMGLPIIEDNAIGSDFVLAFLDF